MKNTDVQPTIVTDAAILAALVERGPMRPSALARALKIKRNDHAGLGHLSNRIRALGHAYEVWFYDNKIGHGVHHLAPHECSKRRRDFVHLWVFHTNIGRRDEFMSCRVCGIIRRNDGVMPLGCGGSVRIELRDSIDGMVTRGDA